jgi:hypothetical protein
MPPRGLSFPHVFHSSANSNFFPVVVQGTLIEFPRELHDPGSIAQGDDKELCQQEERRLFYVGHDPVAGFAYHLRQERNGKKDPTPAGFLRDLLKGHKPAPLAGAGSAPGFQTDMFAEAAAPATTTRTNQWLARCRPQPACTPG